VDWYEFLKAVNLCVCMCVLTSPHQIRIPNLFYSSGDVITPSRLSCYLLKLLHSITVMIL